MLLHFGGCFHSVISVRLIGECPIIMGLAGGVDFAVTVKQPHEASTLRRLKTQLKPEHIT